MSYIFHNWKFGHNNFVIGYYWQGILLPKKKWITLRKREITDTTAMKEFGTKREVFNGKAKQTKSGHTKDDLEMRGNNKVYLKSKNTSEKK